VSLPRSPEATRARQGISFPAIFPSGVSGKPEAAEARALPLWRGGKGEWGCGCASLAVEGAKRPEREATLDRPSGVIAHPSNSAGARAAIEGGVASRLVRVDSA
jgi:hypothetical protein